MASPYAGNLVGHTLGSRFRLIALLGSGASARVYLADDTKLRRRVAVKLLHASLASDEAFLRRFQREAEVLAPLSHPNIVIIHDINYQENALGEPPYLVTEYLAGGSLRNLLDTGYQLSPSQAAVVGLGSARGLAFAHAHGLVHRDIKPANLLFGDDQRVRVGDFGLARALAENARTEPVGSLVGTMKYLSPEQARGKNCDGRSDVFSLALVLWEAMTGSVPYSADTWQGTLAARMQDGRDEIVAPPELGPLGVVLEQALRPEPEFRFDATELATAIENVARKLPPAEPLPLDGARVLERAALLDQRDPTMLAGSSSTSQGAPTRSGAAGGGSGASGASRSEVAPGGVFDAELHDDLTLLPAGTGGRNGRSGAGSTVPADRATGATADGTRSRRWRKVAAGVVVLAILGAAGTTVAILRRTPTHLVPTLEGLTLDGVNVAVADERFTVVTIPPQYDESVPAGQVLTQDPPSGVRLKERGVVRVGLSKGRKPIPVPDLTGLTLDAAVAVLRNEGLTPSIPYTFRPDDVVPKDGVIEWAPKGDVAPGATVSLVVSSGPATFVLPKTRGLQPDEAKALLGEMVSVTEIETFSDLAKGVVTGTEPKSGTSVKRGDAVKLFISKGPNIVVVPNVIGQSPAAASAAMRAAGLTVGQTVGPPDQPVLHTRPVRRDRVKAGTKITLYTTSEGVPPLPGSASTAAPSSTRAPASVPASAPADAPATTKQS